MPTIAGLLLVKLQITRQECQKCKADSAGLYWMVFGWLKK